MYICDELEIDAVARVLRKKKLFRYQGEDVPGECFLFEEEFSAYLGGGHAVLLSSGTNALITSMHCGDIGPGDEVIVPAYTFFATIAAIIDSGATPIIVNINSSLTMDNQELIKAIGPKTKAVIAVHMDGHPCDMDALLSICKEHGLILIEDAAQAVGGKYKNIHLGTIGDSGCFSFNADKIITCGEGGAIFMRNQLQYQKAMLYHDTVNQFGPTMKSKYTISPFIGKSMRVSEIQGAMIRCQLQKLDTIIKRLRSRKNKLELKLRLLNQELVETFDPEGECGTTMRILLPDAMAVKNAIIRLHQVGIVATSPILRPAHSPWHWLSLLPKSSRNTRAFFLPTVEILSRTLNINISLDGNEEEWEKKMDLVTPCLFA